MDFFPVEILIYTYFCAGIIGSLFAYLAQKSFGPSSLFSHGKAAIILKKDSFTNWLTRLTVSKQFFWHFYASGFILSCALCIYYKFSISSSLLALQCLRRLLECLYVMPGGNESGMHLIHYLIGISYYPVLLMSFTLQDETKSKNTIIIWTIFFLTGSSLQLYCHWILGTERIRLKTNGSSNYYPIKNIIFNWIHAPHYFAEFLIYFSVSGINCFHPLSVINLIWIATILGVSAKNSADWLVEKCKFKSHEEFCKYLMIPFLF